MPGRMETVCLFALLVVVGLRPLISERYDSAAVELTQALEVVEDATPTRTVVLDGVILLAAVGWLTARAVGGERGYRRCGIEWGGLLILIGAMVSCAFAGQKRLAANGAIDWLCCVLLAIVLVQLLRHRRAIRLVMCVVAASGAAQAAECFHQVRYSFPETEALYAHQREEIWSKQGVSLDSERVELFEARMRSREAFGYLSHSNVAGAHLVLCGLMVGALGFGRWRGGYGRAERWTSTVVASLVAAFILGGAVLTHSLGALVGGSLAMGLCALRVALEGTCRRYGGAVFRGAWLAVIIGVLAVIGQGLYRGTLPGRSLDYRWKYWSASARMLADHPITGVGSGNFGRHYLEYKRIDSPEEIKNPHNFMVSAATDWGVLGLAGLLAMLYGGSRVICRAGEIAEGGGRPDDDGLSRFQVAGWGIALGATIFGVRAFLLGSDDPYHVYFETMFPMLVWGVAFALLIASPMGNLASVATGAGFALVGFLVQDTINFATLVPGTLTTALACFAAVVAMRYQQVLRSVRPEWGRPVVGVCVGWVVLVMFAVGMLWPVLRANALLREARRSRDPAGALALYDRAADADTWDSSAHFESARLLHGLAMRDGGGVEQINQALVRIEKGVERDPVNIRLYRERSRLHTLRAGLSGSVGDWTAAILAAGRVFALYPNDPTGHMLLAGCWADRGLATFNQADLQRAIGHYQEALRIDDARPTWEVIRRLRPRQREAITSRIADIRTQLAQRFDAP